jgi:S-adenosylmethionine:tRNA ribosyltransferase-isomerase
VLVDWLHVEVTEKSNDGTLLVRLSNSDSEEDDIAAVGRVPLPPYIKRASDSRDRERYQTVFGTELGSVAAPTAGLHLSDRMLAELRARGVVTSQVTLHVGIGTFRPVTAADLDEHTMHEERIFVGDDVVRQIAMARRERRPVVAIGTTVVRALESAADPERLGHVREYAGRTRLLIQPGYQFRVVDALLTNFHMPKSTLLALVSAFAGHQRVMGAYTRAIHERYRFLSYGDAMWIPRRYADEV